LLNYPIKMCKFRGDHGTSKNLGRRGHRVVVSNFFAYAQSVLKVGTLCGIKHWNMEDLPFDVLKLVLAYGSLDVITK
jgi:hypothetical protein